MKRLLLGTALTLGLAGMAAAEGYKIGISNTVQGNGWREEMVCAMKAEALHSVRDDGLVAVRGGRAGEGEVQRVYQARSQHLGPPRAVLVFLLDVGTHDVRAPGLAAFGFLPPC